MGKVVMYYKGIGVGSMVRKYAFKNCMSRFVFCRGGVLALGILIQALAPSLSYGSSSRTFEEPARVHGGYSCTIGNSCQEPYPYSEEYATNAAYVAGFCDRIGEVDGFSPPPETESACFVDSESEYYLSRGFSCDLTGQSWDGVKGVYVDVPLISMELNGVSVDDAVCIYPLPCNEREVWNNETQQCEPVCQPPLTYNGSTGYCEIECPKDKPWNDFVRACASPPEATGCPNFNLAGNPINFLSGHKLQAELVFSAQGDFPLTFSWMYNSFANTEKVGLGYSANPVSSMTTVLHSEPPLGEGEHLMSAPLSVAEADNYTGSAKSNWRHNHSYFLGSYFQPDGVTERVVLYRPDGVDMIFEGQSPTYTAKANRNWVLVKEIDASQVVTGWTLKHGSLVEHYDTSGRVTRVENQKGQGISYTYDANGAKQQTISDDNGNSVSLGYTDGRLTSITRNDGSTYQFGFNADGMLASITYPGATSPQKQFRYEDTRFSKALTGVTDEKGQIYSTFTYDAQGRAIRTEHASGTESVDVEYVDGFTRRLANSLGKKTTYYYQEVDGAKRVISIHGEASANCAAANKGYTYDGNGFVASATDWEGNVTTYTRDALGRELSRTEADGTPQARTTTTEWHQVFNVPTKITTPTTITTFSYDGAGSLLERKVTSR